MCCKASERWRERKLVREEAQFAALDSWLVVKAAVSLALGQRRVAASRLVEDSMRQGLLRASLARVTELRALRRAKKQQQKKLNGSNNSKKHVTPSASTSGPGFVQFFMTEFEGAGGGGEGGACSTVSSEDSAVGYSNVVGGVVSACNVPSLPAGYSRPSLPVPSANILGLSAADLERMLEDEDDALNQEEEEGEGRSDGDGVRKQWVAKRHEARLQQMELERERRLKALEEVRH